MWDVIWSTHIKIHDPRYKQKWVGLDFSCFKRNFNTVEK